MMTRPQFEVIRFGNEDIIATSSFTGHCTNGEGRVLHLYVTGFTKGGLAKGYIYLPDENNGWVSKKPDNWPGDDFNYYESEGGKYVSEQGLKHFNGGSAEAGFVYYNTEQRNENGTVSGGWKWYLCEGCNVYNYLNY